MKKLLTGLVLASSLLAGCDGFVTYTQSNRTQPEKIKYLEGKVIDEQHPIFNGQNNLNEASPYMIKLQDKEGFIYTLQLMGCGDLTNYRDEVLRADYAINTGDKVRITLNQYNTFDEKTRIGRIGMGTISILQNPEK